MFKYLFLLCLTSLNWSQILSHVLAEPESLNRPLDASNYLNLLSKLGTIRSPHLSTSSNKSSTSELSDNVRQLRTYLNALYETPSYDCRNSVFEFGIILSKFVQCLIVNEMPFSLCLSCSQQYSDLTNGYSDLNNSSLSNCSESILKGDKLDLVREFYSSSLSKWSDGDCDSKRLFEVQFESIDNLILI